MSDRVCLLYTTYNRGHLLQRSLERVSQLSVPDEILVVDDGGDDKTNEVVFRAYKTLGLPMRYVYTHNPSESICSHARNVGVKTTDCDVIITSEPEMWFETDVVAQLTKRHQGDQAQQYPPVKQVVNVGRILHEQRPGGPTQQTVNWQATFIALYRRDWLLDVGGWDEDFPDAWGWDDCDLGTRLRIRGVGQYNDLDAVARHMWHPSRAVDQARNEGHFRAKGFHQDERPDHPDVVANRGHDWGVVKSR